jgi:adenine deaminase
MKRLVALTGLLIVGACQNGDVKVLIGGTTIVAPGARPIDDSVIVVAGRKIRSVGLRKDVPIPQDSQRTDLSGKWIVPIGGGRLAPGEPASLLVLDHAGETEVNRKLIDGEWQSGR